MCAQDTPAAPPPTTAAKEGQPMDVQTLRKLWRYALMSNFAYMNNPDQVKTALKALDPVLMATRDDGLPLLRDLRLLRSQVPLIGGVKTDTEVLVALLATGEVILAWRGTETDAGPADVVTDIYLHPSSISQMVGVPAGAKEDEGVKVHRGFLLAFNGTAVADKDEDDLTHTINTLCEVNHVPLTRITCCGHSLGGALATLAAFWCRRVAFPQVPVVTCTFGSPRVGNPAFQKAFLKLVDTTYRFVHNDDIVPSVPPGPRFKHVTMPVLLCQPAHDAFGAPVPKNAARAAAASAAQPPPPHSYAALFWTRPWGRLYLSVEDHMMYRYVIALNSALGRPPLPGRQAEYRFWAELGPGTVGRMAVSTLHCATGVAMEIQDGKALECTVEMVGLAAPAAGAPDALDAAPAAPAATPPARADRQVDAHAQSNQQGAAAA